MMRCRVCGDALDRPLFTAEQEYSLDSTGQLVKAPCRVFACGRCGHLQMSDFTPDLDDHYRSHYQPLTTERLVTGGGGQAVSRDQTFGRIVCDKVGLEQDSGVALLDYGAGPGPVVQERNQPSSSRRPSDA